MKRLQTHAASLVLLLAIHATAASGAELIGSTVPPYPAGLDYTQGVCIAGGKSLDQACDYGMQVVAKTGAAQTPVQILGVRNMTPEARNAQWRVTDALPAPAPRAGYAIELGTCRIDGVAQGGVVAQVRHGRGEYSRDVLWARRLDAASGKFTPLTPQRVDCVNTGYGI